MRTTAEHRRLAAHRDRLANWRLWGPYLAERAWGTVREDYSADADAWRAFPHEHARMRAYRWNEDGLLGFCDRNQYLCLAPALWNGRDPILKERLFGLSGHEGNHGEDAKELWYYLDATPTHSYQRALYKYPQAAFPYARLIEENARRDRLEPGVGPLDLGAFDGDRYFDVEVEYAKPQEREVLCRITVHNRGPDDAPIWVLPTLWFRNTWSWGYDHGPMSDVPERPRLHREGDDVRAHHVVAGSYTASCEGADRILVTENTSNHEALWGEASPGPYVKDAFHRCLIDGDEAAVNPAGVGTKAAFVAHRIVPAGGSVVVRFRLVAADDDDGSGLDHFDARVGRQRAEADDFYAAVQSPRLCRDELQVQRQALAGLLWGKQMYYYDVLQWRTGDPVLPGPTERLSGRNHGWVHLANFDVISMPDPWEYPWYATWDLAFHCLPLAMVDVDYAKRQLLLFTREWYMHPNGQLPAYEWTLDDVNPPVHAWATWRVYKMEQARWGRTDRAFLEGVFQKLLLNFTWWVNRKDATGSNIFQGGFLGLDNIGLFDRSSELPGGGRVDQSDGTSWMAAYSLQMMRIALELARENPVYQDLAAKFFEHYLRVAHAMADLGEDDDGLWDERDGFYYDCLHLPGHTLVRLRVRSLVGLIPMVAVDTLEPELLAAMPVFRRRMQWFMDHRQDEAGALLVDHTPGEGQRVLFSLLTKERLRRVLARMLDPEEFLSPHGIRSLSRHHRDHPVHLRIDGHEYSIRYEPAESQTGMFGGNSNWRGPVWFPINHLLIEALQRYHHYYGDSFRVPFPTGSDNLLTLGEVAAELSRRLCSLFLRDESGQRPAMAHDRFARDPHFRDHVLFSEYFHGDDGRGLGAQHQTGWTALVAKLLQQSGGAR